MVGTRDRGNRAGGPPGRGDAEAGGPREYQWGSGPLARGCAYVYTVFLTQLLFLLFTVPGLVPLVLLLDRDVSNLPLAAAGLIPLGPALAAMVFAFHHRSNDLTELHPVATFWRGYRLNFVPVLRIWVPWLAGMTIIAVNLAYLGAAGIPGWWAGLLVVIAVVATLWIVNALVITSLFTFRTRDIARLAGYFLARTPGATLGNVCLLVVMVGLTYAASEAVLALVAWAFAQFLLLTSRPTITVVEREFTA
ncbi:DUF624 domain-containing protein [Natronosporangium hydrolyticum]|uniref:DUF624 domain-containing protein n=1 Tax=Natronosporangium hydrolyticum TaxID=2811111 RepID=A0A895YPJ8_9ACTN|nr:YesL family protein [Natronosporangium hydrolyticum]QSB17223.1 DUF624 domain-containing protein [Natronosporangium hydrolyticum]